VPVLVDPDGPGGQPFVLTESGAILLYLAEKSGRLLPVDRFERARVVEQMLFHLTGIGPTFGQLGFFKKQAAEQLPYAIHRFQAESDRVLTVLEGVFAHRTYAAGDDFTIADITHFGWIWRREFAGVELPRHVMRWYERIAARPAVIRALERVMSLTKE
jgi:GST-like protein